MLQEKSTYWIWILILGASIFSVIYFALGSIIFRTKKRGSRAAAHMEFLTLLGPLLNIFRPLGNQSLHWLKTKDLKEIEMNLIQAGVSDDFKLEDFMALRILGAVTGVLIGLFFAALGTGISLFTFSAVFFFSIMGWMYPLFWLKSKARIRRDKIFRGLSNTLDLLSISTAAGLNLNDSLERVIHIGTEPELDMELQRTLREIDRGGKSREEAFNELRRRVNISEMNSFCYIITMAFNLGSEGITARLAEQAEAIRNERILKAEKLTAELPAKILFPIAVFIFPAVILVILAPMALKAYIMFVL